MHKLQQQILDGIGSPPGVGGAATEPPGLSPSQESANLAPVVLAPPPGLSPSQEAANLEPVVLAPDVGRLATAPALAIEGAEKRFWLGSNSCETWTGL